MRKVRRSWCSSWVSDGNGASTALLESSVFYQRCARIIDGNEGNEFYRKLIGWVRLGLVAARKYCVKIRFVCLKKLA